MAELCELDADRFITPDLRFRFILGALPGSTPIGTVDGSSTHTLTTAQIPSHDHTVNATQATNTTATGGTNRLTTLSGPGAGNNSVNSGLRGGGEAHNNMPPYFAMNWIIKLG
jgi:microcystin-dependent protein